uniref:Uncharacterized protein n=1 Tax=Pyxicephalus adspersus TaxID=30357 RepID=A0AAV3AEB4_PYXAD|nr:TPA: hypothetical protein GDO54_017994 [Pyxicephalus adspersus]
MSPLGWLPNSCRRSYCTWYKKELQLFSSESEGNGALITLLLTNSQKSDTWFTHQSVMYLHLLAFNCKRNNILHSEKQNLAHIILVHIKTSVIFAKQDLFLKTII